MDETKYHEGDVVTINNIDWTIDSISMRLVRIMNYGLKYKDKNGDEVIDTAEMLDKKKRTQILAGIKK